jgi:hypothetical protein
VTRDCGAHCDVVIDPDRGPTHIAHCHCKDCHDDQPDRYDPDIGRYLNDWWTRRRQGRKPDN